MKTKQDLQGEEWEVERMGNKAKLSGKERTYSQVCIGQ